MASKDNYDPGWNDPPIFTYDKATAIQTAAASKKGAFLNKRVAFPISGSIGNSPSGTQRTSFPNTESGPLPPMFHPSASPNDYVINEVHNSNVLPNSYSSDKVKLDEVLKNLKIDTDCDEEIKKRIKIMEKMWLENKLKKVVQLRILELSKALGDDDAEKADHIQKSLMVDHVSQCSSWMSGIRHLINKKRNQKT